MTMSAPASMAIRASFFWFGERRRVVLGAPVREDDDDVRAGLAGRRHVRATAGRQRRAADPSWRRVVARGDRVVAEDRDLRPGRLEIAAGARRREVLARAARPRSRASSTFVIVWRMPGAAGVADVVVGERDVVDAGVRQAVDEGGSAEKTVPLVWQLGLSGAGFSKLAMAMSAPSMRSRTAPALPVRFVSRQSQPKRRAVLAAPRDLGRPAIEREVRALALDARASRTRRGRAGCRRPRTGSRSSAGSKASAAAGGRESRRQRPVGQVPDAIDAEQRVLAPGERADLRPDGVGAQEGESLAVLRQVGGEGRGVLGAGRGALESAGTVDPERREDRVGLRRHELERVV